MLILFTRGTALGGVGNDAAAGELRELPNTQARMFINAGRAVPAPALVPGATDSQAKPKPKKAKPWTSSATAP